MSLELCIWLYIELFYVCFFVYSPSIWLYIACYRFFYVFIAIRWVYMGCDMLEMLLSSLLLSPALAHDCAASAVCAVEKTRSSWCS